MSNLFRKLFRFNRRESKTRRSHRHSQTFGCERLEERVTLSATTAAVSVTSFVTLPPNEGGFIAFDVVSRVNFDGTFFLGLDNDGELILSGTAGGNTNGLFGDWRDLDSGQVVNSGTGDLSSGENPFATIPPPELTTQPQPAGGTIAIAEIFFPSPNSLSGPAATEGRVSREQMFRAAEILTRPQTLPATQGRDIAFEVAFNELPRANFRIAKTTDQLLDPPILQIGFQSDPLPQEGGHAARQASLNLPTPDSSEASVRVATYSSPRKEHSEFSVASLKHGPIDRTIEVDHFSEAPHADNAGTLSATVPSTTDPAAASFDQVFANWHDRREQVAQLREQDHYLYAWEVVIALAFGGLVARRQHSPAESEIEQEPPRRKKSTNCKNLA